MALATMGMDPATAAIVGQVGGALVGSLFAPAPASPELAMVLAAKAQQDSARRMAWIIGGVAAAGLVGAVVLISRK